MAPKLKIHGTPGDATAQSEELAKVTVPLPLAISVQQVVDVTSAREAGDTVTVELTPSLPEGTPRSAGEVCAVELEGGITLWLRPGSLYRDFGAERPRGAIPAGESDVWEISPACSCRGPVRGGAAEQKIRRVTVYRWERLAKQPSALPAKGRGRGARGVTSMALGAAGNAVAGLVAGKFAGSVARMVELHLLDGNGPGLYGVELADAFSVTPASAFTAEKPILLFLHGTLSSFAGSFKELWNPQNSSGAEVRGQLARRYGHAYAWEHCTLTESPIENALTLARQLPEGARLHLVSHSRGGLVGDLLCLGQRAKRDEALSCARIGEIYELAAGVGKPGTPDEERKEQAGELCKLIALLDKKKLTVERFVRVACPARGTTLASGKLDRWLSVVKLLHDLAFPSNFPLQLLIALIAEHDDPGQLPGLEAMMPGSPLVRILNYPGLQVAADLSVIAGNTESKGLFGRLKELMLDRFYADECDIIVNTGAMFGGLRRVYGGRFHLQSGPEMNHFSYFTNDETVRMLAAGLLRSDGANAGFRPLALAPEKEPARAILHRAPLGPLPVVFVLPGIMGTTLEVEGDRIWLGILGLLLGKFGKLAIDREVTPKAPFEDYYSELMDRLRETHEVIPFPYDWRRSILKAGEALASQINLRLDEIEKRGTNQPVRILAHSMGGLVARAMIAQKPQVWQRMTSHDGSRLIMLGAPNSGSYEIVRLITGCSETLQQLSLLDFTRNWAELLEVIVRFPGVLELLPIENDYQWYRAEFWQELREKDYDMQRMKSPLPGQDDLREARRTWEKIRATPLDPGRMLYVAGQARQTPVAWRGETEEFLEYPPSRRPVIVFEATARGDGKVPWETGIPQNIRTWYLPDVEHGDLPAHEEAFPAYVELLQSGATTRLETSPPAGVRAAAAERRTIIPRELPPFLPDERELAGSILGAGSSRRKRKPRVRLPKIQVSVTHGDLGYAQHPVIVGHYAGDTIVSAEESLDKALAGRLRERHMLGLYPGRLETCEVVLNPDRYGQPAGAIVIGLGRVGELSPGNLETAITQAALQYAIHVAECPDERFGNLSGVPRCARITSLLIGTGAGGMTVRDSIEAILRGVAAATRRLHEQELSGKVLIDAVEFLELWQDIAIQTANDLERTLRDGALADLFIWQERTIKSGEGGRRRVQFEEAPHWWHRLEIVHDQKNDELRFISLTDRARAEESLVAGQLRLAEDLIRRTIADTSRDTKVTHALFEMLIPNRLKELAPNQDDVVLVLDEVSGSYPWELLENRWSRGNRPAAVSSGMLRQLKTAIYRERPVTTLEDKVYVVGDPLVTGEAARQFPSLEGARREAVAVADFFEQNGFTVTRQIRSDARAVLAGIHDNGYRVLHLAGHGVHEVELPITGTTGACEACEQTRPPQTKKVSGMVIGDGVYLTPGDVEQMRWTPELVFINCCHLGSIAPRDATSHQRNIHRLAANIAAQFIRMGVKAVVAAGWAVEDAAAETFAVSFYGRLLAGDKFGDAVRSARAETFDRHSTSNTWGAYQCYGEPDFLLRPRKPGQKSASRRDYVSAVQAATDLENLTSQACRGVDCGSEVEAVVQSLKEKDETWLETPEVATALGLACGELGMFPQAVAHLDRAITGEKAAYPVLAIEQRADFKSRWAVEMKRDGTLKAGRPSPHQLIAEAIAELGTLLALHESAERLRLLGSAHKRRAWIETEAKRKEALAKMAEYYRKAHQLKYDEKRNRLDVLSLLGWLAAEILCGWYNVKREGRGKRPDISAWCEKAGDYGEEKFRQEPSFKNSVIKPECDLVLALQSATLDEKKQAIIDAYRRAKDRGAAPREFSPVISHLEFLADMAAAAGSRDIIQKQAAALREMIEQLAPLTGANNGT